MSESEFTRFLSEVGTSDRLARYAAMTLPQLLFHARNEGYAFTADEAASVIGRLEYTAVTERDGQPFDGGATLWRAMWGRRYLDYLAGEFA